MKRRSVKRLIPVCLAAAVVGAQPASEVAEVTVRPADMPGVPEVTIPSSVPVEAATIPVAFDLPFSLSDCYSLLSSARDALRSNGLASSPQYEMESVGAILETVTNYLRDRDNMHSSLIDYEWQVLATQPVTSDLPQPASVGLDSTTEGSAISALSFEVEGGDATLHRLDVYDDGDELVGPFKREVTLRHSLPRRYVFHLYRATDVKRLEMSLSKSRPGDSASPRIVVLSGRTDQPEHGKAAIHYIWRAQQAIAESDYEKAEKRIQRAQTEILEYRQFLRFKD